MPNEDEEWFGVGRYDLSEDEMFEKKPQYKDEEDDEIDPDDDIAREHESQSYDTVIRHGLYG